MEVSTQFDGTTAILSIVGRVDGTTMTQLEQAATHVIDGGSRHVILDMRKVEYISSAGLRAILLAAKRAKAAGGGVALFGLQPDVEEVMTTSGFSTIIPIATTDAEARDRLGS